MESKHEDTPPSPDEEPEGVIDQFTFRIWQIVHAYVDRYAIYPRTRWIVAGLVFLVYVYRAYINQGMGAA